MISCWVVLVVCYFDGSFFDYYACCLFGLVLILMINCVVLLLFSLCWLFDIAAVLIVLIVVCFSVWFYTG